MTECAITRLAVAIEKQNELMEKHLKIAGSTGAAAGAASNSRSTSKANVDKEAAETKTEKAPKVSEAQLTAKIKEVAKAKDKTVAQGLFQPLGYDKIADIKPEHYDEVYDAAVAALESDDL